jgi:peroxiredoxin
MKMKMTRFRPPTTFLVLLLVGFLLVLELTCTSGRGPGDGPLSLGSPAPDFELPELDGDTIRLSDLRGKVVFVNFWTTWCAPCREEMPSMDRLNQRLQGSEFVMLSVSVDEGGEPSVREFLGEDSYSFPILMDATTSRRLGSRTGMAYGISGVPETFIIDREGYIIDHFVGALDWTQPDMIAYFEELL